MKHALLILFFTSFCLAQEQPPVVGLPALLAEEMVLAEETERLELERQEHERLRLLAYEEPRGIEPAVEPTVVVGLPDMPASLLGVLAPTSLPVTDTTNLFGIYTVARGAQVFSWTQPLVPGTGTVDQDYTGFRLYWWTTGSSTTNTVDLPKGAQKIMMSGLAGGSKPLTFFQMAVVNGAMESPGSNLLLVPSEP